MECPLCESKNIEVLEEIKKDDLVYLNNKLTGINTSYLIKSDVKYVRCNKCDLRFFDPLITGEEKFYNALQKYDWYYQDEKEEFKIASKYIDKNDRVLEVGSGKGAFTKYINKENYVGLDFSTNAKEMAAKNRIKIENLTIEKFANKNIGKFDVVCSFQVLEHVSNPKSFIESKLKTINGGGKMIIAVPNEDTFMKYVVNGVLNMPPHHVTRWSKSTFEYIANKYNLELEIITEKVQPYHKDWYINTMIRTMLFGKERLIVKSLVKKTIIKIITICLNPFQKNFKNEFLPDGMTIIGVFRKKAVKNEKLTKRYDKTTLSLYKR